MKYGAIMGRFLDTHSALGDKINWSIPVWYLLFDIKHLIFLYFLFNLADRQC